MKKRLILIALFLGLFAVVRADEKPDPAETFRNLTVSVPKLKVAPKIDGKVDPEEWKDAAMAPRFVVLDDGNGNDRLTLEQKKIYWGYTDDAFYMAFQIQRPDGLPPAASLTQRDASFWHVDDDIEFHLNNIPSRNDRPVAWCRDYYFCWNALGTQFDRLGYINGRATGDKTWNPDWQISCRVVPGYGWEGEARWPFSIFASNNVPVPKSGDIWYCDVVENTATPSAYLAATAFSTQWSSQRDFQSLIFRDANEVFARVLDVGCMREESKQGIKLEVVNPGTAAQKVNVVVKLYKQKSDAATRISYLRAFDQSRDRPEDLAGRGKAPLFLSDDKVAESILTENYDLKKEFKQELSLAGNERKLVDMAPASEPGTYVVMYDVSQGADPKSRKIIAGAALPFVVPKIIDVKTTSYVLTDQSVQVRADLEYIPGWKGQGTVQAQVKEAGAAGKTVFDKTWNEKKFDNLLKFDVGVTGWTPGDYRLQIVTRDVTGKELAQRTVPIQIPAIPQWFTEKVGLTPVIPEPYKPIKVDQTGGSQKLSFLMGEYDMKDSVFADHVRVQSIHEAERKDLLRGPIQLKARINGQEMVLGGGVKVQKAAPEAVECNATSQTAGLAVSMTGAFEFDGMEKVTLKVGPAQTGGVSVEGLWLEIPMSKEYSELIFGFGELTGGPVSMNQGMAPWTIPEGGIKVPFRTILSVGNEERRMVWFAENFKGWKLDGQGAKECIELSKNAEGAATLKVNLIKVAGGFKLEKEREIIFGLMFTPARSLYPKPIHHGAPGKGDAIVVDAKECDETSAEHWYFYSYMKTTPPVGPQDFQGWPEFKEENTFPSAIKTRDLAHSAGVKVLPYTGWFLHRKAAVYPMFGGEMVSGPLVDGGCGADVCCWNTPVQDVFVSLLKDRILDAKIDGFRFDAGYVDVFPCNNLKHHGYGSTCGWIDDDGNLQSSVPIFAARKVAERTFRIFHGGVRDDGLCTEGRVPAKIPPVWSFFDAGLTSEGMDTKIKTMKDLPLEYYRANQMGDAYGMPLVYMPKCEWTGVNSRLGISFIHNNPPRGGGGMVGWEVSYSRSAMAVVGLWKLVGHWANWPDPKTEFWGYWKNAKYLESSDPDLKASFYVRRGERVLLGVMNLARKPMDGSVKMKLADLGFTQAYAQDAFTGEDLPLNQGELKLDFLPEGYRLVKITSAKPADGLPQKIGENLLPEADPAKWPATGLPPGWSGTVRVENGNLVLIPGATLGKGLTLDKEKRYVLEMEARVECDDGVYLGESPLSDGFFVTLQGARRWSRSMGSQMLPGKYETLRLIVDQPTGAAGVSMTLNGKGKVLIRKIGLYAIQPYTKPYERE